MARPLLRAALPLSSRLNLIQVRRASQVDIDDPDMVLPLDAFLSSMTRLNVIW